MGDTGEEILPDTRSICCSVKGEAKEAQSPWARHCRWSLAMGDARGDRNGIDGSDTQRCHHGDCMMRGA